MSLRHMMTSVSSYTAGVFDVGYRQSYIEAIVFKTTGL